MKYRIRYRMAGSDEWLTYSYAYDFDEAQWARRFLLTYGKQVDEVEIIKLDDGWLIS